MMPALQLPEKQVRESVNNFRLKEEIYLVELEFGLGTGCS